MRPGLASDEQVLLHVFVEISGEDRHLQLLTRWATELPQILFNSHPIGHQGNSHISRARADHGIASSIRPFRITCRCDVPHVYKQKLSRNIVTDN